MSTIDFLLRIRNFRRNNWRIWHLNMTDNESVLLSLFSSCVVDRHTLLLRKTSLSASKWSVRGKSGNKDQSLGSSISHYPHVCSVFSGWWDWSQISIHSTPEEGSRFVYCFIAFNYQASTSYKHVHTHCLSNNSFLLIKLLLLWIFHQDLC